MLLTDALRGLPFFEGYPPEQLEQLTAIGRTVTMEAGQTVFAEGDEAEELFVILDGEVRISRGDRQGGEATLSTLGSGDYFGELALINGGQRSAGARTSRPSRFFVLRRGDFLDLLGRAPRLFPRLFADLTSRIHQANERILTGELLRARQEVEKHRSISEMVAGVAHEINTPIGIVNTAASVLSEQLTDAAIASLARDDDAASTLREMREAAELIQANIQRASRLIQSFKSLSVDQITEARGIADFPALVGEIVELYRIRARRAGIVIAIADGIPEDRRTWDGYPGFLAQVLLNLLQNVESYAYLDHTGGRVDIGLAAEGERFVLTVRDYGSGIPPENLPRVFDPFFTTGRGRSGTGLGLAIVRNLVTNAMQGTVQVASEPGAGTTFTVTLPRVVPERPRDRP